MQYRPSIYDFLTSEQGATAVEYAVILALLLVAMLASIAFFGSQTGLMWTEVNGDLNGAGLGK